MLRYSFNVSLLSNCVGKSQEGSEAQPKPQEASQNFLLSSRDTMQRQDTTLVVLCTVAGGKGDLTFCHNILQIFRQTYPQLASLHVVIQDQGGSPEACVDILQTLLLDTQVKIHTIASSSKQLDICLSTSRVMCVHGPVSASMAETVTFSNAGNGVVPTAAVFVREMGMGQFHYDYASGPHMPILYSGFAPGEAGLFVLPEIQPVVDWARNSMQPTDGAGAALSGIGVNTAHTEPSRALRTVCHLRSPKHCTGALRVAASIAEMSCSFQGSVSDTHLFVPLSSANTSKLKKVAYSLGMVLAEQQGEAMQAARTGSSASDEVAVKRSFSLETARDTADAPGRILPNFLSSPFRIDVCDTSAAAWPRPRFLQLLATSDAAVVTGDASLNEAICTGMPFWYAVPPHKVGVRQSLYCRVASYCDGKRSSSALEPSTCPATSHLSLAAVLVLSWWGWVEYGVEGKLGGMHLNLDIGSQEHGAVSKQAPLTEAQQLALDGSKPHRDWSSVMKCAEDFRAEFELLQPPPQAGLPLQVAFSVVCAKLRADCCRLDDAILDSLLQQLGPSASTEGGV